MDTLAEIIDRFHSLGSQPAYVQQRGYRIVRWSYRQISESARLLAAELIKREIEPGDHVLLWGNDCAEWVICFFASVMSGAVVVPVDRIADAGFVARICGQVNPRMCLCSCAQPQISGSLPVITFDSIAKAGERSVYPFHLPELNARNPVEIVFTSGTTADPKGVVLSHANILANLEPLESEIRKYLKYERLVHPLRFLNLLPLSHVFGQFMALFIPHLMGSTVVFHDTLNPTEILRTIKRERVSAVFTVPRVLDAIRHKIERDVEARWGAEEFNSAMRELSGRHFIKRWWRFRDIHRQFGWRFWAFISGGASLNPDLERFWKGLGFAVIQGYGLTETTSLISVNHPFKIGTGSIGRILPGRELRLAPDGEILVRGQSIAMGYYHGHSIEPVQGEEGWFHTGDVGALDESGNLFFKGRRKNVIVSPEGMNIYPEDLETALRCQPEIRDCVVLGLEWGSDTEQPCAVLILQNNHQDPEPVIRRANQTLAEFQRMHRYMVWPEEDFPRTATQKPQLAVIRERVKSHLSGTAGRDAGSEVLSDLISRITGREIKPHSGKADLTKDLGLSSIERVELLSALEDRFQIDLNESRFTAASTIADLESMVSLQTEQRTPYIFSGWAQNGIIRLLRIAGYYFLVWPATLIMAFPRIAGRAKLRNLRGPVLFAANHITQADIGFVLAALPLRFRHRLAVAMSAEILQEMRNPSCEISFAKRWITKSACGLLVALFNVFPLPQDTGLRESFKFAGESADRGYSILIFPEGTRTKNGKMNPFRAGIGLLAKNLNLPIVPLKIEGLFELKRSGKRMARPFAVRVKIGDPLTYEPSMDSSEIARDMFKRISDL